MTDEMMALRGLMEKSADADFLREMIDFGPRLWALCARCKERYRALYLTLKGALSLLGGLHPLLAPVEGP